MNTYICTYTYLPTHVRFRLPTHIRFWYKHTRIRTHTYVHITAYDHQLHVELHCHHITHTYTFIILHIYVYIYTYTPPKRTHMQKHARVYIYTRIHTHTVPSTSESMIISCASSCTANSAVSESFAVKRTTYMVCVAYILHDTYKLIYIIHSETWLIHMCDMTHPSRQ